MNPRWSVHKFGGTGAARAGRYRAAAGFFSGLLRPAAFPGAPL
jgi:hypothetical protein